MEGTSEALDGTVVAPTVRPGQYLLYSFNRSAFVEAVKGLDGDDHFLADPTESEPGLGALMESGREPEDRVRVWMHYEPSLTTPSARFLAGLVPTEPTPSMRAFGSTAKRSDEARALNGWNTGISRKMN